MTEINPDRRHIGYMSILHNYILPSALAAAAAYLGVSVAINTLTIDGEYMKRDIEANKNALVQVTNNQLLIAEVMGNMQLQQKDVEVLRNDIARIKDRLRVLEGDKPL
jgi:hypothetical protein